MIYLLSVCTSTTYDVSTVNYCRKNSIHRICPNVATNETCHVHSQNETKHNLSVLVLGNSNFTFPISLLSFFIKTEPLMHNTISFLFAMGSL